MNITLERFDGEMEVNIGTKTSLKMLMDESKDGVVWFTYPKVSVRSMNPKQLHKHSTFVILPGEFDEEL